MFEFLLIFIFVAVFMLGGLSIIGFVLAGVATLAVVLLVSLVGAAIHLLPWIIVALIALYFYKQYQNRNRQ